MKLILPSGHQTTIKVKPQTTMEDILKSVCEKRGLNFEDHTLQFQDTGASSFANFFFSKCSFFSSLSDSRTMDLDRPLSFYKLDQLVLRVTESKEKSYSTMFVSEGDRDVMVMAYANGK